MEKFEIGIFVLDFDQAKPKKLASFSFQLFSNELKILINSIKQNPQNRKPLKWLFQVKFKMGVSNHNVVLSKIDSKYISRRQIS